MVMIVASDDGYRLEGEDGTTVGSLRRGIIRLGRFENEAELLEAAPTLWRALEGALRMHFTGWPRYEPVPEDLCLAHDGAYEWVSDGRRPLVRVIRPMPRAADRSLRLEFVLPSYATDGVAISVASVLTLALQRVGDLARAPRAAEVE